jgi:predicted DNA-binding transcriptional regulator AlpA
VGRTKVPALPHLTDEQLSRIIHRSKTTLRRWRRTGYGPKFVRLKREIRYRRSDVEAWLDSLTEQPAAKTRAEKEVTKRPAAGGVREENASRI